MHSVKFWKKLRNTINYHPPPCPDPDAIGSQVGFYKNFLQLNFPENPSKSQLRRAQSYLVGLKMDEVTDDYEQ